MLAKANYVCIAAFGLCGVVTSPESICGFTFFGLVTQGKALYFGLVSDKLCYSLRSK